MSRRAFSTDVEQFLLDLIPDSGLSNKEVCKILEEKYGITVREQTVQNWKKHRKLRSGWQMPKGSVNAGTFKPGQSPKNRKPVGTISSRPHKSGDKIRDEIYIKVAEPNKWMLYSRYVYEQNFGPIPEGYKVKHLDGNPNNFEPDNLFLYNNSEQGKLYGKFNHVSTDKEITKAVIYKARLELAIKDIENKEKSNETV